MSIRKPLAIIIKGNPKYLDNPAVQDLARTFYGNIEATLESNGFRVEYDAGEPYTTPKDAAVWVAHSRGIDRIQYAPAGVLTVALETKSNDGLSPDHYILSLTDKLELNMLTDGE